MKFLALDLETSGLDPEKDRIIEVALVKFENGEIKEKFQSLVNPGIQVEQYVLDLTGIKQEELDEAPRFLDLKGKIVDFIGDHPLVGHNLKFDIDFFKNHDLSLRNKVYDTWYFSTLLLPWEISYSLEVLTKNLNLTHSDQHRALSDATAAVKLFSLLMSAIKELPPDLVKQISELGKKSDFSLGELFQEEIFKGFPKTSFSLKKYLKDETLKSAVYKPKSQEIVKGIQKYLDQDQNAILEFPCTASFDQAAVGLIKDNLKDKKPFLLVIPDFWYQQVFLRSELSRAPGSRFAGRDENQIQLILPYSLQVNWEKVKSWEEGVELSSLYASVVTKLLIAKFYRGTEKLNVFDCSLTFEEQAIWPQFADSFKTFSLDSKKPISIISQEVFCGDQDLRKEMFESGRKIVFWQANHLRETLKNTTFSLFTPEGFAQFKTTGDEILKEFEKDPDLSEKSIALSQTLKNIDVRFSLLLGMIAIFVKKRFKKSDLFMNLMIDQKLANDHEWSKVNFLSEKILVEFHDLKKEFEKVLPLFKSREELVKNFLSRIQATTKILENFFSEKDKFFKFVEIKREDILLGYIDKGKINNIKDQLKNASAKLIFVDKNFTVNKDFESWNYFYDLPLEKFKTESFSKNCKHKIPIEVHRNLGYFSDPRNKEDYKKILSDFVKDTEKDLLIVSNSFNATQRFYYLFKEHLKKEGYSVFAQGISGGRPKITEKIKENPHNVIIGTLNFIKGVEINPIDRLLILHLPFQSSSDPLVRVEEEDDSKIFGRVILPQAILRFKDILGFLRVGSELNSEPTVNTTRCGVWDQKLVDSPYSRDFENSLPECFKLEIL
ncbi:exonuclease domain-containing protein [Patescibacteria group bacterium]